MTAPPNHALHLTPAIASLLPSWRLVGRVAELGSLAAPRDVARFVSGLLGARMCGTIPTL